MSDETPKNEPISSPDSSARRQTMKRAAIFSLIGAGTVGIVILLLALMNGASNVDASRTGFIVAIDQKNEGDHFIMTEALGVEAKEEEVLVGKPLGNAALCTINDITTEYKRLTAEKGIDGGLYGSNNYELNDVPYALFYTFHLQNTSEEHDQVFRIQCRLNQTLAQLNQGTGARAYDFLRLGLFMGNNGEQDDQHLYFGSINTDRIPNDVEGYADYRECISKANAMYTDPDDQGNVIKYRSPDEGFVDAGNGYETVKYAEAFEPGMDQLGLFDVSDLVIPAGKVRRVTFVAYLEAWDPDTEKGTPPKDQYLSFSLSIGV